MTCEPQTITLPTRSPRLALIGCERYLDSLSPERPPSHHYEALFPPFGNRRASVSRITSEQMLSEAAVKADGLVLGTAEWSSFPFVRKAIEKGLSVLNVNPLICSPNEWDYLNQLSSERRITITQAGLRHYNNRIQRVHQQIEAGEFGTLRLVTCQAQFGITSFDEVAGRVAPAANLISRIYDTLDVLLWWLGPIISISADLHHHRKSQELIYANLILRHQRGPSLIRLTQSQRVTEDKELYDVEGTTKKEIAEYVRDAPWTPSIRSRSGMKKKTASNLPTGRQIPAESEFELALNDFAETIAGNEESAANRAAATHQVLQALQTTLISSREKAKVTIPIKVPTLSSGPISLSP
ncbi:MAG: hypothetical protein M1330_00050 [Armatimonadetes bacterium]|nr:hypothetical protein [Armatimonadota bacterium]